MEIREAKFLCSYGGEIKPRGRNNKLAYIDGTNKLLYVDRRIDFTAMVSKISSLFDGASNRDNFFKYQVPGSDDLNALVSVTNDRDLHNMMLEDDFELVEKIVKDILRELNNHCLHKDVKSLRTIKNCQSHSHLWDVGDACDVLENNKFPTFQHIRLPRHLHSSPPSQQQRTMLVSYITKYKADKCHFSKLYFYKANRSL
ncbi:hypothetical protein Ahy_A09g046066 [Arachis hypogaea]|uniref:PB1 domain-containing protein n=1 Tax=Arachis hypogaea TaxID=3818 RepID=A0A445BNU8_ARAHY|nr:hypothetical protein Ahy_A09g046066 [Arachis hypogaea]